MSSSRTPLLASIQSFVYQDVPGRTSESPAPFDPSIFEHERRSSTPAPSLAPGISELEVKKREAAAYERGLLEGSNAAQAETQRAVADAKRVVAEHLRKFEQEKDQYYKKVEAEVVDLALAIAEKVLHREAQVDRIVLKGVVRVALEKVSGSNRVSLRVHPSSAEVWREYLSGQQNQATATEVVPDESLQPDQVILKTVHGSTDLSIDAQLAEIRKGLSDLVQQRAQQKHGGTVQ